MNHEKKRKLLDAVGRNSFIDGASDFINMAADALITQSAKDSPPLAQPLSFITVEQRQMLDECRVIVGLGVGRAIPKPATRGKKKK